MRAVDLIVKKRSGAALSAPEIRFLVQGYVNGEIPDYQVSAWLMAVFFQGMSFEETGFLTRAMIDSGDVFHLEEVAGALADKHSTGGVGDKISLVLAPLAAACGLKVPMMSGRALGHTGGTLDKLDSISGYSTRLTEDQIVAGLNRVGFVMTGQSEKVVPADRLLYALRDVTGTVESIPLITASILSKKFAEGAQTLVFDVKCGRGAFMKDLDSARRLASCLVETGRTLGRRVVALLTDMDQPLGRMTGNFLEVEESFLCLQGQGSPDVIELTLRQTAWMLQASGLTSSLDEALELARRKLQSGEAMERFLANVAFQGGDVEKLKKDIGRRRSYFHQDLRASRDGWVEAIDAYEAGLVAVALGAGRSRKEDQVLSNVGIEFFKKRGDSVRSGETLARIHSDSDDRLKSVLAQAQALFEIADRAPADRPLILDEMAGL